jgi:beta-1,4-mannosyl-glycoprotein beta-1,4-N-acetylglucosaminyltransferase
MVNDELDWLEIRFNTTYDYVDYFVIVEAEKTFTNLPKPLTVHDNMDKFAAYRDKIIYHQLEYPADFDPKKTWDLEELQRNAMFSQVFPRLSGSQAPTPGDAIVVADVDEIPRPETLTLLRKCEFPRRLTLRSRFYYYSFQFLHRGPEWAHPQATFYEGSRTILPSNLRGGDGGFAPFVWWDKADLGNAAWHCSSCFATLEMLLNKMQSFSHMGLNQEYFRDRNRIVEHIREGKDLWDREGEEYDKLEGNLDVPPFISRHPDRFSYLLHRDEPAAGFLDYQVPAQEG